MVCCSVLKSCPRTKRGGGWRFIEVMTTMARIMRAKLMSLRVEHDSRAHRGELGYV
jgi:hypothetical protein